MSKQKPQALLSLTINDHTLTGEKRRGKWKFACPSFPDLADTYDGADTAVGILGDFTRLALSGAILFRKLAEVADA